jgi:hypothetical protein
MRFAILLVALLALLGCEKGPPPLGTIQGHVTQSVLGGMPDENGKGVVTTTPLACTVSISASGKHVMDIATGADGAFEARVPVGHYTVSFKACGDAACDQVPRPRTLEVDVTRESKTDASWVCAYNAG